MNKFQVINNATTIINDEFINDPWIYGDLYHNAWSPYYQPNFDKAKLKKIKYCFISHIHQDHWDMDTIKYFPKNTLFLIPDLVFNRLIEKQLSKKGFKFFKYLKPGKFFKIENKYMVSVVPALNDYGQEEEKFKGKYDYDITLSIDSGVIIKTLNDDNNHLLLGDNCPYNLEKFEKYFKKIKIQNCFFPYNGYASDYPLCYSNLTIKEKKLISLKKINYLQKKLISFFKFIKPKFLIPYSSEFSLNTKFRKDFFKINDINFFKKDEYIKKLNKIFPTPCVTLNPNDIFRNKFDVLSVDKQIDKKKNLVNNKKISLNFDVINEKNIEKPLELAMNHYLERVKRYKMNLKEISKTSFFIQLNDSKNYYHCDFKNSKIVKLKNIKELKNKKILILKSSKNIILNILYKKAHINNCIIGSFLIWKRYPNKFNKDLDRSLNFFHI
tara:strand:+ start:744 stop:2063 length:1320 start_codon:yes stop_codon:yes gene_type:complete